jgi:hypothetical protein
MEEEDKNEETKENNNSKNSKQNENEKNDAGRAAIGRFLRRGQCARFP